jgi:16S rRNA (uracil1498-N3)-methyltransferase
MADRFYTPTPPNPGDFTLVGSEAHHLTAVRRFGPGDRVVLFCGDGREFPAEVVGVSKRSVALSVGEPVAVDRERTHELWVAAAVPKGDRADYLVEKLTELGATRFVPLLTARSVVVPKGTEKFERQVIEASKQCGRNVLMRVEPPQQWAAFSRRADLPAERLILHTADAPRLVPAAGPRLVAVGPEGGFAPDEVAVPGWAAASLGPRVLRVETAAVAGCVG